MEGNGQSMTMTDELYEEGIMGMYISLEFKYEEVGDSLTLGGIQEVDRVQAYKMTIANPTGSEVINYYQVDTGLKIKSESPTTGTVTFNKYEDIEGIQYPRELTLQMPGMPMSIVSKVESVTFN